VMQQSIAILAVGMCDEDHFTLREALAHCRWNLVTANTIAEDVRGVPSYNCYPL
jgi:hypothetical protein